MSFSHTTREVTELLRLSDATLRRLRKDGVLKPGVHFRAVGFGTQKPALLWDPTATDAALANHSRRVLR